MNEYRVLVPRRSGLTDLSAIEVIRGDDPLAVAWTPDAEDWQALGDYCRGLHGPPGLAACTLLDWRAENGLLGTNIGRVERRSVEPWETFYT